MLLLCFTAAGLASVAERYEYAEKPAACRQAACETTEAGCCRFCTGRRYFAFWASFPVL